MVWLYQHWGKPVLLYGTGSPTHHALLSQDWLQERLFTLLKEDPKDVEHPRVYRLPGRLTVNKIGKTTGGARCRDLPSFYRRLGPLHIPEKSPYTRLVHAYLHGYKLTDDHPVNTSFETIAYRVTEDVAFLGRRARPSAINR